MQVKLSFSKYSVLSFIMILTVSCGKKAIEKKGQSREETTIEMSALEAELSKQELYCESTQTCPSYLTKVAIVHKDRLKFCTGFLTDKNTVVTASSCLPETLRSKDLPCNRDVFFFFARTNEKPQRVACKKILEASQIDSREPFLWRSDVAYLEIEEFDRSRFLLPSRNGMADMDQFYIWGIDQIDDHQGIIHKKENCQSVHNSYFNPLANNEYSPVMIMAGCEFNPGNGGSPILDYRGKVRGIVSKSVENRDISEFASFDFLAKPLKKMIYSSNYACAPTIPELEVASESECGKVLDYNSYDFARREMINEANLFKASINKLEFSLNEKNRYLKLSVKLTSTGDSHQVEIYPKCFKNVSKWIGEFNSSKPFTFNIELPDMILKKSMNEYGRMVADEIVKEQVPTNFQFKPSILRSSRQATVFMWAEGPTTTFSNLSEDCGSLF